MGHDKHEAADVATHRAYAAVERVAVLLDRYDYDNGTDADVIDGWADRLRQLEREILATLGEPRTQLPCGGLVPARNPKMGAKL